MRLLTQIAAFLAIVFCGIFTANSEEARRPNIIFIVADDLGYGDLGCFGCKDIPTPNIDGLARDGVKFTDAHAYQVCSPTRAALLTGRYAEHNGVSHVLMGGNAAGFAKETTIASILKEAGYKTGAIGKWHLGYSGNVTPMAKGFSEVFGFRGGKIDCFKHTDTTQKNGTPAGKHDLWEGDTEVFREGYSTDLFTSRARQFIRSNAQQPFFLYLAYNAPHYSQKGVFQAPEAYLKRFDAVGKTSGRGVYAAMVNCMDDGVGQVLAELKEQKLEEKTLVIFMSDNGGEGAGSNGPLSGAKHQLKEGGIRVPWIARWPGVIPAGSLRKDVVHVVDILPSMLALTGAKAAPGVELDGINIWPAFTGGAAVPERPIYYGDKAIRSGSWKLLQGKLYNLDADLKETTDVSSANPEIRAKLEKQLGEWAARHPKKKGDREEE